MRMSFFLDRKGIKIEDDKTYNGVPPTYRSATSACSCSDHREKNSSYSGQMQSVQPLADWRDNAAADQPALLAILVPCWSSPTVSKNKQKTHPVSDIILTAFFSLFNGI